MKKIILTSLIALMLTSNVAAGTDGENKLSKQNSKPNSQSGLSPLRGRVCWYENSKQKPKPKPKTPQIRVPSSKPHSPT